MRSRSAKPVGLKWLSGFESQAFRLNKSSSCYNDDMELYRNLRVGSRGDDVSGAKRSVYKLLGRSNGKYWKNYLAQSDRKKKTFGVTFRRHLIKAQKQMAIKRDKLGVFGQNTLDALVKLGATDHIVEELLATAKADPYEEIFEKLIASMESMSAHTPGYQLGGGHGVLLKNITPYQRLDCSSSCSKALYDAGIFPHETAIVSGVFQYTYGNPGTGEKYFTVYANPEHVWIRLYKTRWWRFDTSPHGDGGRGPKLRMLPRFSNSFSSRHWPNM